jgi:hypothetical protein
MDRLRAAAHRVIGRMVMPSDAPQCPRCGSPFLTVEREAYGKDIDTVERCATCGESWSQGSADWDEVHPAMVALYSIDTCPCCGENYDECDCPLVVQADGTVHCDEHDKVCEMPQESEIRA